MTEPAALRTARTHLARAEAGYRTADGLFHLEEAFALLDGIMAADTSGCGTLARNLAATYSSRILGAVSRRLEDDAGVPEPELEHFFKLVLMLDNSGVDLPPHARAVKIELARRLVDFYYEGHTAAEKQQALEQLAAVTAQRPSGES